MKKRMLTLVAGLLLTAPVCRSQTASADVSATRKVITDQTDAFFAKNRDKQTRQRAARNLKSREVRILEKQGADWKLVSVYSRNIG